MKEMAKGEGKTVSTMDKTEVHDKEEKMQDTSTTRRVTTPPIE